MVLLLPTMHNADYMRLASCGFVKISSRPGALGMTETRITHAGGDIRASRLWVSGTHGVTHSLALYLMTPGSRDSGVFALRVHACNLQIAPRIPYVVD